jgi:D-alanyl-lipoteichoic acid acyltransferase DltB (MBOAT superfamily)
MVPPVTIRLVATSVALLYGQRLLCANRGKWTRRITLLMSILVSGVLSALGIFLLVLATNDDYRRSNFVSLCTSQALRSTPLGASLFNIKREWGTRAGIGNRPRPGYKFQMLP